MQDTTEMNYYSRHNRIKEESGLGRLDAPQVSLGFKMHSTLLVDALEGTLLGFSDLKLWHRPVTMPNRRERSYTKLPIEDKESYKWISAANNSKKRLSGAASITFIEDSELETGWAIRKLCIMMMSALLRIIQMNLAYNEPEGGQPVEEVFDQEEIRCLSLINKKLQGNTLKLQNLAILKN